MTQLREKIIIGTVKFGIPYGVGGASRLVEVSESKSIINSCISNGLTLFDTAPSYGLAEQILGDVNGHCTQIITKVAKNRELRWADSDLEFIDEEFHESLKKLNASKVYGLLIHDIDDLEKEGADKVIHWMNSLKKKGLVEKIGLSVYTPDEARKFCDRYSFDVIQLPYNLFDQRFQQTNTLKWLKGNNIEIHARSLFLKGVLIKPSIDEGLGSKLIAHHRKFHEFIRQLSISSYDVCLSFAYMNKDIDYWVIGVADRPQLNSLLSWNKSLNMGFDYSVWAVNDSRLIDPRIWG